MALTKERNTAMRKPDQVGVPLAATKVYAGALAVVNASGFGAMGSTATTLTYIGRWDETVDNSGGAAGAAVALATRGKAFFWKNSGTDPGLQAGRFKTCYIVDDETVAATNGTNTRSAAGIVVGIESGGVWVV